VTLSRVRAVTLTVAIAGLVTACATTVTGTPTAAPGQRSATTSAPDEAAWIASVLPDATELSRLRGSQTDEISPLIGDADDLRDTIIGSQVTESQCVGVVSPLESQTFDAAPVREVAYATLPDATFGVLALPSADDARSLFETFVNEWRQCDGTTVIKSDGADTYENTISDVNATDRVLSAVTVMSTQSTGMRRRTERALGVAEDCIVEVEMPVAPSSARAPGTRSPAVELAELMLTKVSTAQR